MANHQVTRREFLANAASISIMPTDRPGVSLIAADEIIEPTEYVTTPEAHGWAEGNSVDENTKALQAAVDDAAVGAANSSTGRGVVELTPGKTYVVRTTNGTRNNQTACITARSNVEIRTKSEPPASIQFESWKDKIGVHNQTLIRIENINNFRLNRLTLDGNKNTLNSPLNVNYAEGQDGGLHNITCYGRLTDVLVSEVTCKFALTDGMIVDCAEVSGVLVENCDFTRNRRQGVSIGELGADGFDSWIFSACLFTQTGDYQGDIPGQQPGYGVDVEPDHTTDPVNGLTFEDCIFKENYGSAFHRGNNVGGRGGVGLKWDCRADSAYIKIIRCQATGHTGHGEGMTFITRGTKPPVFAHWLLRDNDCTGNSGGYNGGNQLVFYGSTGGAGGLLQDIEIINTKASAVYFESGLNNTGHSVTIQKGPPRAPVTTNGKQSITVTD